MRKMSQGLSFGSEIRERAFTLQKDITFLNHGSVGAVPKRVQDAQRRYMDEMYGLPDLWSNKTEVEKLEDARISIAEFVQADSKDIVFVQNTTTGVNAVLKSLKFKDGDIILYTNCTYEAVKYTCQDIASRYEGDVGVRADILKLKFPITSEDEVVDMYRQYFTDNNNVRVAVIDHISSPLSVKMPIEKLIPLCKEFGVLSLVDGAHAPGQIPLNLRKLDADFYIGNLHKWLFCPRAVAILYVARKHQYWIRPVVTSLAHHNGFQSMFRMQSTRDETAYCVVPEAVKFYKDIGGYSKIYEYASAILCKAEEMLTTVWKTDTFPIPKSMEPPFMRLIRLPSLRVPITQDTKQQRIVDNIVKNKLVIFPVIFQGQEYLRITSNIYNTEEDYKKLCEIVSNGLFC